MQRQIIRVLKGLRCLFKRESKDLYRIKNLSHSKIVQIKAFVELGERIHEESRKIEGIVSSQRKHMIFFFQG